MAPKQWSMVVDKDQRIRRSTYSPKKLMDGAGDGSVQSLYAVIKGAAEKFGDRELFGQRDVLDIITEEKEIEKEVDGEKVKQTKKWNYFKLSPFKWVSYNDVLAFAHNVGSGFRNLGLAKDDRVLICAPTSKEWTMTAFACASQSIQIVTAYDTLGEDGLRHATVFSDVSLAFLKSDKLPVIARIAQEASKKALKHVVYYGKLEEGHQAAIDEIKALGVKVSTLDEVEASGKANPVEVNPPSPDDIAMVMFTSGSTGDPKGVLISHKNIVSVSGGIELFMVKYLDSNTDVLLCYLPLAHILEVMVEMYAIYKGIRIGYGTVKTLTNDNVRQCEGDLLTLKPSIMIGVPQVWDTIRAGIQRKVKAKGSLATKVFNAAISAKSFFRRNKLPTSFFNSIFGEVAKVTGGRLKLIVTGGAPISDFSQKFLSAALCPMIQGYGMTECSGLITVQIPEDTTLKSVGPPVPSIEIKLADVEEMGYYAKNNQGEVWLRGPSVFKGYLNNEEETKKTMTEDGWLKTGDIGEWLPNGQLALIDRLKNLVKLSQGEYVALEKLESLYKLSLYVDNICVCANSELSQPVAVIVPNQVTLTNWAKEKNIKFDEFADLTKLPEVKKVIFDDLLRVAKTKQLAKFETLSDIVIEDVEWIPESGLVTAASKLKRRDIQERHKVALQDIFGNNKQ